MRGVDASTGMLLQPRGSVPRASNFLLTKRGSLRTCDGSAIVNAFNGVPTVGRGKAMCEFLYAPIGVARYYLRIMKVLDQPLGPPQNPLGVVASGGILSGPTHYKVTALDGAGGETLPSVEVNLLVPPANKVTLTWNVVTNAAGGYNIYRSATAGAEVLIATAPQANTGSLTASFVDTGIPLGTQTPPDADTTQQTGMFIMYPNQMSYNVINNQVAIWPADAHSLDGSIGGGSGGGGGTGQGSQGTPGVTPSGVYPPGNVSFIPQMVQFVNQVCIALGDSYPPQVYSDLSGSPDNPAVVDAISSISVDAFGVVTIQCVGPHTLTPLNGPGACIYITGMPGGFTAYDGCYQILSVPTASSLIVRNLAAVGLGTVTNQGRLALTTIPIYNTFLAQFPAWAASTQYAINTVVIPSSPNGFYYKVVSPQAGGESGTVDHLISLVTIGGTVQDGPLTWLCVGTTASAAPPPPGAAHIAVYEGALWAWDTYSTNTANGLDGPCCLRMSNVNEPNSWNPVNQAFLDKDDGFQGMGLQSFTLTAQGIPPEGSLVACKLRALYQILGVFGSANFAIQRISTDMGCLAPRTLQFISGFGIGRMAHLGIAVFDGVSDRLISPQVTPYLFPTTDPELADIVVADSNWIPVAQGVAVANPAMYCVFIPIGSSGGALTRALCFDLVLKGWSIIDLPFPVSTTLQAQGVSSNPVTLFGSFSDGTLQRWQAGDVEWATSSSGSSTPAPIAYMVRTPIIASKDPEERIYCRRVNVLGKIGDAPPPLM